MSAGDRVAALSYSSLAEYDLADADAVVKLPAALAGQPFPGEPLGCAINIFRRSDIEAGQTVAIVGIGFLGAILTRLASRCRRAGDRDLAAAVLARRRPRAAARPRRSPMDDHDGDHRAGEGSSPAARCATRVIEAVGKQWPLDLAGELTGERGRLIIAGYHQDGPRQVNMQLWNWRGIDVINAHERDPEVYVAGHARGRGGRRLRPARPEPRSTPTPSRSTGSARRSTRRATGRTAS